jgi:hypothetical protein
VRYLSARSDVHDLDRFVKAQAGDYERALSEILVAGRVDTGSLTAGREKGCMETRLS